MPHTHPCRREAGAHHLHARCRLTSSQRVSGRAGFAQAELAFAQRFGRALNGRDGFCNVDGAAAAAWTPPQQQQQQAGEPTRLHVLCDGQ